MGLFTFKLPDIGEGMHEGEIIKWHIQPGETVEEDQVILEVQNDKAVVELPSPVKGKVNAIHAAEGKVAVVGEALVTFEVEGAGNADADAAAAQGGADTAKPEAEATVPSGAPAGQAAASGAAAGEGAGDRRSGKALATPAVRKLARGKGVDITLVAGTGRHGQVTREDVLAYADGGQNAAAAQQADSAAATAAVPAAGSEETPAVGAAAPAASGASAAYGAQAEERVPFKGIRKVIAAAMSKSVYTAPHVTVMDEVDVAKLVEFRRQMKPVAEKRGVKLTYLPFIVKALVAAVKKYPVLNATIDEERNEIVYKKYYNIGIATDTEQGLIVPVIPEADRKSIWSIAEQISDLAARGRDGKLAAHEMRGSTVTITNIGSAGGMFFTPVINFPEVAILGTGRISQKPIVRDGELAIGEVMALSLSFDHRIIDGATAQQAMNDIKQLLADPQLLMMEV